ncbi:MAG: hypothetical protein J6T72_03790 [Alphaproteobacteria bacterium]|nr:hypothetical protein [Alphaproteobacteria bacterium]
MIIGIIKEQTKDENRVAITPDIAKNLSQEGHSVLIETNSGTNAGFPDDSFHKNSAIFKNSASEVCSSCDILLKIWAPLEQEKNLIPDTTIVIGDFSHCSEKSFNFPYFALEKMPRISKAQSMDILSSQDNLAGYKATLLACNHLNRCVPMMITSAGSIPPINVFVFGLGVVGLQAAATAKRLGAKVFATDLREETAIQAISVGAQFVSQNDINTHLKKSDIIICSAGRYPQAPILITPENFSLIPKTCTIIDIANNTSPQIQSSTIIKAHNLPSQISNSASRFFARNLYNFLHYIYNSDTKELFINFNDEIIHATYNKGKNNV